MGDVNRDYRKQKNTLSILDLFSVIVKHRWLIIASSFFSGVLIVSFFITTIRLPPNSQWNFLPNYYKPSTEILIQQTDQSVLSRLSSSSSNPLSIMMGIQTNPEMELATMLLNGNMIKDQIIEEFNFIERYDLKQQRYPKISARKIFVDSLDVDKGETTAGAVSNIFTIKYRDIDSVFAKEVLSRIVELLEGRYKNLTLEQVLRKKRFIEERLQTVEIELQQAQNAYANFQLSYGVLDMSNQMKEQMRFIEELQSKIIENELKIQSLKEYLPDDDPKIVLLKKEIEKKQLFITDLKTGSEALSGTIIPQNKIPSLTAQYLELKNELEIKQSIYKMLRNEYEAVRIQESDNSRTFQVIEPPELLEKKTGPQRAVICMLMVLTVFVLGIFISFLYEYMERIKADPIESKKLIGIKDMLKTGKKK